ncbi:hypothetical protein IGI04_029054 [Brassica rapa subsp. trilocularis]|uniref:Uncharacterized protein n=1 Tax=Brassica rapa subsp. trilocularis TaxID=1813537 RepID=A0ABQ7L3M6_BRACM|nr:hypothetical protein IGI04_029054 [Brassica rapa subsp. trilocularis]
MLADSNPPSWFTGSNRSHNITKGPAQALLYLHRYKAHHHHLPTVSSLNHRKLFITHLFFHFHNLLSRSHGL